MRERFLQRLGWRDQKRHAVAVLSLYPINSTFENRHSVAVMLLGFSPLAQELKDLSMQWSKWNQVGNRRVRTGRCILVPVRVVALVDF